MYVGHFLLFETVEQTNLSPESITYQFEDYDCVIFKISIGIMFFGLIKKKDLKNIYLSELIYI